MSSKRQHSNSEVNEAIILACQNDPWYFITSFCYTEDADNVLQPFNLFPDKTYLRIIVEYWKREQILLVPKSRQMLLTWLMLCLHLWQAMFKPSQEVFIQGKREDDVILLFERIRAIYNHLPQWMKRYRKLQKDTMLWLRFNNRSNIKGLPEGGSKIRGNQISALLSDEFAFQESAKEAFKASKPAVGKTGKITLISSAEVSFFYDLVSDEGYKGLQSISCPIPGVRTWKNKGNNLRVVEVKYFADPDKDPRRDGQEWFLRMRSLHSDAEWEREFEINWAVRAGKRFYPEFSREEHIRDLAVNLSEPIYRSWDFGYHHPAVTWCQIDWNDLRDGCVKIYVLHEEMGTDITLEDFARKQVLPVFSDLRGLDGKPMKFLDCCDAAGTQKNDKSERTSIDILTNLGLRPRYQRIGIKPGCDMVRRILKAGQFIVNRDCDILTEGFCGGYIFPELRPGLTREESELPEPGNYYGHLMDTLRYIVVVFLGIYMDTRHGKRPERMGARVIGPGNDNHKKRGLRYVRRVI